MNDRESRDAVGSDRTYIAYGQHIGSDLEYARGRVLAYQEAPTVLIETPDGRRVWWAAHLTAPAPEPAGPTWRGIVNLKDGPTLSGTITNVTKVHDSDADTETFTCDFTPDQEAQQ